MLCSIVLARSCVLQVRQYSTMVGQLWYILTFIFRLIVVASFGTIGMYCNCYFILFLALRLFKAQNHTKFYYKYVVKKKPYSIKDSKLVLLSIGFQPKRNPS